MTESGKKSTAECIKSEVWAHNLLANLKDMRDNRIGCDFEIRIEGQSFEVHRSVLVAGSKYFKLYFGTQKGNATMSMELETGTKAGLEGCIEFMYSGEIQKTTDSELQSILQVAKFLEIDRLIEICIRHLKSRLSVKSCLTTSRLIQSYGSECDKVEVSSFITSRFSKVMVLQEFNNLEATDLIRCLRSLEFSEENQWKAITQWLSGDKFITVSFQDSKDLFSATYRMWHDECVKWEAMLKWVKHDASRSSHLPCLMRYLDFKKISAEYILRRIRNEPLVSESRDVGNILLAEASFCISPDRLVMLDSGTGILETFDIDSGHRSTIASLDKMDLLRIVSVSSILYLLHNKKLSRYSKGNWVSQAHLFHQPEESAQVISFRGDIYIVEKERTSRYTPLKEHWTEGLPGCGLNGGFCLAATDKFIYAVGGLHNWHSARKYDAENGNWTAVARPKTGRRLSAAALYEKRIHVIGGSALLGSKKDVEIYDEESDEWLPEEGMSEPRADHSAVVYNDRLYVLGGTPQGGTIQIFSKALNMWRKQASKLQPEGKVQLCVCTL